MKQKSLEKWQGQASLGGLKGTHKDFWNNKKQKRKKIVLMACQLSIHNKRTNWHFYCNSGDN